MKARKDRTTDWKNPGVSLIAIGVAHAIYGLTMTRVSVPFLNLFKHGLIGKLKPEFDGGFWFHVSGFFMIVAGESFRCYLRDTKEKHIPHSISAGVAAIGVFGTLAVWNKVIHGFPSLILQAWWMTQYVNPNYKKSDE